MEGLSDRGKSEVRRCVERVAIEDVDRETAYYRLFKDGIGKQSAPKQIRDQLDALQKKSAGFLVDLELIRLSGPASLIDQMGLRAADCPGVEDLIRGLRRLQLALPRAAQMIPRGRRQNPRSYLVTQLAHIVDQAGYEVSAKPMGALCKLTDIILRDVNEKPSSIHKIVLPVMSTWKKRVELGPVVST